MSSEPHLETSLLFLYKINFRSACLQTYTMNVS